MSQSKPPTPMPKPVTSSVGQPAQAAPGVRPGGSPAQQGQRIAAHGQTIYVQQQRGVDPRWIAIASVTATLVALLFVAVVLWQYRNQPAQQQAPLIINVNSGQHGSTTVSPQAAVPTAAAATPASSAPVAVVTAAPSSTSSPVASTPTTPAAAAAPVAAAQPSAAAPVAVTPPAKPSATPAVKRESPAASAAAAGSASGGSSIGSASRSAIPEAGEEVTKPVAAARLGPAEPAAAGSASASASAPGSTPATGTAHAAAGAPDAPAAGDAARGAAASKTAGVVVPWNEANQYMGKLITVEGTVVATRNTGSVCFLNFDKNWRDKFYIAIVEPSAMTAWPKPPQEHFLNQKIRVTGKVSIYQDRPQMRITQADQITIVAE